MEEFCVARVCQHQLGFLVATVLRLSVAACRRLSSSSVTLCRPIAKSKSQPIGSRI